MTDMVAKRAIADSTVTITGGTGSFGSTMATHLLSRGAAAVHIFSRDESKQDEMRRRFNDERMRFFLGDVRDRDSITPAMQGADYVFHAAALKQVPSCEFFPQQAVYTNITGSHNVIQAAEAAGVQSLVCLSTDKAVYPVNAMGMTKALMEKTAQAFARTNPLSNMNVSITRYGNVMYSRGSVIPLFVERLKQGQPLNLTEPTMTRFLMSLADSVDLVVHAFLHADQGDLFIKKAPASTVEDLAKALAQLMGQDQPELRRIGMRHGEKMHETLLSREEMLRASDEGDYFRVPLDARSLQYDLYFSEGDTGAAKEHDYTSENTHRLDVEQAKQVIRTLPEIQRLIEEKG